jgi:membrane protease YdiL (CAAX protease family)
MIKLIKRELQEVLLFIKRNYSELVVIGAATLFITVKRYHVIENAWLTSFLYLFILPVMTIIILLKRNPLDFGLRLGDVKTWSIHAALTILVGLPILYFASDFESLEGYYADSQFSLIRYAYETVIYMLGWEFIFRGFILFGLKDKIGEAGIFIQMIPFVLLHLGKPEVETISTIFVGIYLGYVAYRGNSFWPAFIIHIFINIMFLVFVNML